MAADPAAAAAATPALREPPPRIRKWVFRAFVLLCLGAYAWYSHAGFRIALRGYEWLDGGRPATARKAFFFVLDRQSFCLAVPLARALVPRSVSADDGPLAVQRLAEWEFEGGLDRGVGGLVAPQAGGPADASSGSAQGRCTPLNCDYAPLAALALAILLSLALNAAFFLRKRASAARRVVGLLASAGVLAWVLADPYLGLRVAILRAEWPPAAQMAYDYAKYALAALLLLLTVRQWFYVRLRGRGSGHAPLEAEAAATPSNF